MVSKQGIVCRGEKLKLEWGRRPTGTETPSGGGKRQDHFRPGRGRIGSDLRRGLERTDAFWTLENEVS